MSTEHVQYVSRFLVMAVNSDQFQLLQSYSFYSSHPFLSTLDKTYTLD